MTLSLRIHCGTAIYLTLRSESASHWLASDFRQEKLYGVGLDCNPRILDSGVSQFQSGCCQAAVGQSEDELEEDRRFVQNL
jgi:hypothetical protein